MSQSDISYIVFCRIAGIKELTVEEVGPTVIILDKLVKEAITKSSAIGPLSSHSSVYGRLVVVPGQVVPALEFAKKLLKSSAKQGVLLAIGIAQGRVESTQDLLEHNIAGVAINRAARLAHLPNGEGKIAVEAKVAQDAIQTSPLYKTAFSELQEKPVKKTQLAFHWLFTEAVTPKPLATAYSQIQSQTVHVVVYDIADFSAKDLQGLRLIVESLRIAVREALRPLGVGDPREAQDRLWYAPAGDGGVIVFKIGSAAWTFAKELRKQCSSESFVPIRIGATTGPVAVVLNNLPIGNAIIEADALSGLPPTGGICASKWFWDQTLEAPDRLGWISRPHDSNPNALILSPDQSPQADKEREGPNSISSPPTAQKQDGHDPPDATSNRLREGAQPAPKPQIRCLILLSEADRGASYQLEPTVVSAIEFLSKKKGVHFEALEKIYATEAATSPAMLSEITSKLCRAEVVIFDITNYEPAMMILMGIRAVVRRGVSILSMGGTGLLLNAIRDLPFNIKDANIVSHAGVHYRDADREPWRRLARRVDHGIKLMGSSEYLDLPAYDAIRNLPIGERSTIPPDQCVLALVPFNRRYDEKNWELVLRPALDQRQALLDRTGGTGQDESVPRGIVRSLDLDSPRLVSHAIYGFIRRTAVCLADWTGWRPNIFFELGVRMAATDKRTVCVIDKSHRIMCVEIKGDRERAFHWVNKLELSEPGNSTEFENNVARLQAIAPQCLDLIKLLNCVEYELSVTDARAFAWVFDKIPSPLSSSLAFGACRAAIVKDIDTIADPVAVPLHRELIRSAERFINDQSEAVSALVYPEHPELLQLAARSVWDRMRAAWNIVSTYDETIIFKDSLLLSECITIINSLTASPYIKEDKELKSQLTAFQLKINQFRRQGRTK